MALWNTALTPAVLVVISGSGHDGNAAEVAAEAMSENAPTRAAGAAASGVLPQLSSLSSSMANGSELGPLSDLRVANARCFLDATHCENEEQLLDGKFSYKGIRS